MKKPYVKVKAMIRNELNDHWDAEIEFDTVEGKTKTVIVEASELTSPNNLYSRLVNSGLELSSDLNAAKGMLVALAATTVTVPKRVRSARTGWRPSGAFVHPRRIIGKSKEPDLLPPIPQGQATLWSLPKKGTLKGWQAAIQPAQFSSAMLLAATVPFAAICMKFAHSSAFGIMLNGPSKRGKSTASLVCSSAIGIANEDDLPSFNTSAAAMMDLPSVFNDLPLVINELGTASSAPGGLAKALDDLAYKLADGKGKMYSNAAYRSNVVGLPSRWRTILLASSEKSAADLAGSNMGRRPSGAAIRLCDLPVLSPEFDDMFDLCELKEGRQRRSKKRCEAIRAGILKHHGVAAREFILGLQKKRKHYSEVLRKRRTKFLRNLVTGDSPAELQHLADNFAHVYAAGSVAVDLGILPFTKKLLKLAIRNCFARSAHTVTTDETLARDGRKLLFDAAGADNVSVFDKKKATISPNSVGFYVDRMASPHRLVVRAEECHRMLKYPGQASLTLVELCKEGMLINRPALPAGGDTSIKWATKQIRWPGQKNRTRSILIKLPA